jgi:hypothetical protein|tara:strand:- start:650 stop:805 length:156 start_codon:yes stop_codon:yes gene_type:complete
LDGGKSDEVVAEGKKEAMDSDSLHNIELLKFKFHNRARESKVITLTQEALG